MKYSRQRELVRRVVYQNLTHPTADDIYSLVRMEDPNISLGTVYRNLNLLVEQGKILKIQIPHGSDRFDGRLDPHHHLVCEKCGQVFDIGFPNAKKLEALIMEQPDFAVTGYHLLLYGVCHKCEHQGQTPI